MNKEKIAELKEKLLEEEKRLKKELTRIAKPDDSGEYKAKFEELGEEADENASEISMYGNNLAIEDSLEKQLKNVITALKKIDNGSYGKCEECGGDIRKERLKINPSARRCMNCAK